MFFSFAPLAVSLRISRRSDCSDVEELMMKVKVSMEISRVTMTMARP